MKTLTIISVLISLSLAGSYDSIATHPFNIDITKKVGMFDILKIIGPPDSTYVYAEENMVLEYPNLKCYLHLKKSSMALYSIEILEDGIDGFKLGMSKRKVIRTFGRPSSEDCLSSRDILEYACYRDDGKYVITLEFQKKKLRKMLIAKDPSS